MTSRTRTSTSRDTTRAFGATGCAGVAAFAAVFAVMHAVQPDLDPVDRFGSDYANGDLGWLMQVGIVAAAAGSLALAVGLRRSLVPGKRTRLGVALVVVVALGFAGSGVFRTDPPRPDGTTGYTAEGSVHDLSGMVLFLALVVGTFVLGGVFGRDPRWGPWRRRARIAGALILAGLVVTATAAERHPPGTDGDGYAGLAQRVFFAVALAWIALLALQVRRLGPAAAAAPAPAPQAAGPPVEPVTVTGSSRAGSAPRIPLPGVDRASRR